MEQEDLEREILKVTKQGGLARAPWTTILDAVGAGLNPATREAQARAWIDQFCQINHLRSEEGADMFGSKEERFEHIDPVRKPLE